MAATHKTVNAAGGADYTTIAAAIAATSSGTGAGDRSTITIQGTATYNERIAVGSLQWLDIIAEDACVVTYGDGVVTFGAGANNIRFIGDPNNPALFRLNPGSGSGADVFEPVAGCSFYVDGWDFESTSGTGCNLVDGVSSGSEVYSFTRCDCLGGSWQSPVKVAAAGSVVIDRCDWTAMVDQTGPLVTTNAAALTVSRSWLKGATLLGSTSALGTPAARHSVTNSILIKVPSASWNGLIDLRANAGGHSIGADIWDCVLVGDGASGQAGFYSEYTTTDVKNVIVTGFARGWWTTGAWSPTYCCTFDYTDAFFGSATAGTGCITDDPELDADYQPARGSPVVDAGTASGLTVDIGGFPRPVGDAEDMGAWELGPVLSVERAVYIPESTVEVACEREIDPATIGTVGDWALFDPLGALAVPNITHVSALGSGYGASLTVDGEVLEGTWVRAPATIEDLDGYVIDSGGREAEVEIGDAPPESWSESAQGHALHVDVTGQAIDDPAWSPLPSDPYNEAELLDRAIVACLGTDAPALPDDVLPQTGGPVAYRGGAWSDRLCPSRRGTRIWLLRGADPSQANAERGEQIYRTDLQWLIDEGWATAIAVTGATDPVMNWLINVTLRDGTDLSYQREA